MCWGILPSWRRNRSGLSRNKIVRNYHMLYKTCEMSVRKAQGQDPLRVNGNTSWSTPSSGPLLVRARWCTAWLVDLWTFTLIFAKHFASIRLLGGALGMARSRKLLTLGRVEGLTQRWQTIVTACNMSHSIFPKSQEQVRVLSLSVNGNSQTHR